MKRPILLFLLAGLLAALSLPMVNWVLDRPTPGQKARWASLSEPYFAKAAPVLESHCAACHMKGSHPPFYAALPLIRGVIRRDITEGLAELDMQGKLTGSGNAFSKADRARIAFVLENGSMPPARYTAVHWRARMTQNDRQAVLNWLKVREKAAPGRERL
ncbi:MAG: heme-binding domain-containing protein [Candidatus Melainabacteria bacterium]